MQWGITCAHAGNDLIDISDITSSKSLMVAQVLDLGHGSESGISTGSNIEKPVFVAMQDPVDQPEIIGIDTRPDTTPILVPDPVIEPKPGLITTADNMNMIVAANDTAEDIGAPGSNINFDEEKDFGPLTLGPGYLEPGVEETLRYDDNVTYSPTGTTQAFINILTPKLGYVIPGKKLKIKLDTELETGLYGSGSVDNYIDFLFKSSVDYQPTSRIYSQLTGDFTKSHDGRGTGRALGGLGTTQDSPDEWHRFDFGSTFAYGAATTKGRVELEADYGIKRYDNNRTLTFVRALDELGGAARFFYRVRPKTYAVLEGRISEVNYQNDAPGLPSLDSLTTRQLLGVTWLATFKTSGFLKLGLINKDFYSSRTDNDGFTWEVGVDWKPKTYSIVRLKTDQSFEETNGTGDAIDTMTFSLNWEHGWRPRIKSILDFIYTMEKYDPDPREDNIFNAGARVDYEFRRWLNLSAGYRFQQRSSSTDVFEYDQNIFELTADFTFY